ncbi:putative phosphodiesterase [Dysgonomonas sp. PH5-45]|uniref:metallophosphoesterase family protein n=1 Tax=unclassified Dysgonomonas TaxID=2630389 RepID=UPI00247537C6|nr:MULTISPECIES: metallophosphoesterase [unclassified Dysgonomonas]MDH6355355.1 putative phosphodiesterase [Dysgonomonas sp. PH5-45]MDH6388253.1 putative phosphodiesterase [Dysgonomonas sp. PH5-37]
MRAPNIRITLSLFFLLVVFFVEASSAKNLKIGVIADVHYLSEQLMDKGSAIQTYCNNSGKNIQEVPAILDKVLADYLQSDIDVLLIAGDMTKDGERLSHQDFVKKLQPLRDKGIRVFVVPGNHDINMPNAKGYRGSEIYSTPNISPTEFSEIYAHYGYGSPLKRDTASLSYVAELDANTWLVAIDACRYGEYTTRSISGGKINQDTERWIADRMAEAKEKGVRMVGMMHHGMVEHIAYQATFFPEYIVEDWQGLASLFADGGMAVVFTGHFHANDITRFTSGKDNDIYDIETGSLSAYPFPYRMVTLTETGMNVETRNITSTPANPLLAETDKAKMQNLSKKLAVQKIKSRMASIPATVVDKMADIVAEVFVMHVAGDEIISEEFKKNIAALAQMLDPESEPDFSDLELDYPPADNKTTIEFQITE